MLYLLRACTFCKERGRRNKLNAIGTDFNGTARSGLLTRLSKRRIRTEVELYWRRTALPSLLQTIANGDACSAGPGTIHDLCCYLSISTSNSQIEDRIWTNSWHLLFAIASETKLDYDPGASFEGTRLTFEDLTQYDHYKIKTGVLGAGISRSKMGPSRCNSALICQYCYPTKIYLLRRTLAPQRARMAYSFGVFFPVLHS
jgi:hypothetical protein